MTPKEQEQLALIPTQTLFEEFARRFDHSIVAGMVNRSEETDHDPSLDLIAIHHNGFPLICQGLAHQIIARCDREVYEWIQRGSTGEQSL